MFVLVDNCIVIKYTPGADFPPLQASEPTTQTVCTTNTVWLIDVPQLPTTFPAQSRIGNIPVYTHTHTFIYMSTYTYISYIDMHIYIYIV